jgi:hypothetical protein
MLFRSFQVTEILVTILANMEQGGYLLHMHSRLVSPRYLSSLANHSLNSQAAEKRTKMDDHHGMVTGLPSRMSANLPYSVPSMVSERNRTEPSPSRKFAPPGCLLPKA